MSLRSIFLTIAGLGAFCALQSATHSHQHPIEYVQHSNQENATIGAASSAQTVSVAVDIPAPETLAVLPDSVPRIFVGVRLYAADASAVSRQCLYRIFPTGLSPPAAIFPSIA